MLLRLAGAFVGACVVVFLLTAGSASLIKWWDDRERNEDDIVTLHPVSGVSGFSSVDLAELLGEPKYQLPEAPRAPIPPPLAGREISGFVIVEVTVNADGNPINATVVEAEPAGIYEQQAIRDALAETYTAGAPGKQDTVIRFSVSADEVSREAP